MPLLQVCPTLNDRTPDNPWPQREQVPKETYAALPADADLIREATARLSKAPTQAPALVAQTPHAPRGGGGDAHAATTDEAATSVGGSDPARGGGGDAHAATHREAETS